MNRKRHQICFAGLPDAPCIKGRKKAELKKVPGSKGLEVRLWEVLAPGRGRGVGMGLSRVFAVWLGMLALGVASQGWAQALLQGRSATTRPPTVSRSPTSRLGPGAAALGIGLGAGAVAGQPPAGFERFMRGGRSARDFVGTDSQERRTFVGQETAEIRGSIRSAVSDLRAQREVNVNQPARQARGKKMYNPRLAVRFEYRTVSGPELSERIARQLELTESLRLPQPLQVSVEGGTATLRGVVASEHDREIAELLVRFEPGISSIRNELKVEAVPPAEGRRSQAPSGP